MATTKPSVAVLYFTASNRLDRIAALTRPLTELTEGHLSRTTAELRYSGVLHDLAHPTIRASTNRESSKISTTKQSDDATFHTNVTTALQDLEGLRIS
ncbi:hypothetical protein PROFUN_11657 [Planoprotostelium fungivorum]|uniref:Uncharacterized protein n=1 Tax=Planoprotostelium fungivorum TaxID=1890364 RepID=A0A2P6N9R2_9EUKA|nr:hypothetical protein PROFUN_11657 [Planoprotostelium fungivorum]